MLKGWGKHASKGVSVPKKDVTVLLFHERECVCVGVCVCVCVGVREDLLRPELSKAEVWLNNLS